jgi:hypothetical protein
VTIESADLKIIESVRWLQRLQRSGFDNSSPSTLNLHNSLEEFCRRIVSDAPIRKDYWIKREEGYMPAIKDSKEFREEQILQAKRVALHARFV